MITSLSDITMRDFISLLCGNYKVLVRDGEHLDEESLKKTASDLSFKYRQIVNPSGAESALMDIEDEVKVKSRLLLTSILQAMDSIGMRGEVTKMMAEIGHPAEGKDVKDVLNRMRAECEYLIKKSNDMRPHHPKRSVEEIREYFDAESAMLMSYYRMQIDLGSISAGVYANMIHQAEEQVKRMKGQR